MAKSPLILAALAKGAVPDLQITQVTRLHGSQTGLFDSALLTNQDGNRFVVRIPQTSAAALELDVEISVLKALSPQLRSKLPFRVTNLVGLAADEKKNRVAIFEYLDGSPINLRKLSPNSVLAQSVAESIAAIHGIDTKHVAAAGLPEFDSATVLRRRINDLDSIAMTGRVSKRLLERWQDALEDVNMFRFQPRVVHGELSEDTVLTLDNRVSAILNWGGLHIGDPAEDLFWLAGNYDQELMDAIRLSYLNAKGAGDATLIDRAQLYFELECGRWMLHTLKTNNAELIDDAQDLLNDLDQRLESDQLPQLRATPVAAVPASELSFVSAEPTQSESPVEETQPTTVAIDLPEENSDGRKDLF